MNKTETALIHTWVQVESSQEGFVITVMMMMLVIFLSSPFSPLIKNETHDRVPPTYTLGDL